MSTNQHEVFAAICYLVLMQNGQGVFDKSPDYIIEKKPMLNDYEYAFAKLDHHNQSKVIRYCLMWQVELPDKVREYLKEVNLAINQIE